MDAVMRPVSPTLEPGYTSGVKSMTMKEASWEA